ncbi:DUF5985 family protein [Azospirillum rugosum]|uniref:Uncharacterized protein n=1 Tax=Azospirillum rugosum TaxID=416170 RepID=A0ABS4SW75_9PROT|nr:DUF5985 family protein [Azospirillum rugosum]MBP2296821.1 hypothetical protein [Azospirillum rugosum]MDQ0530424.1 hypothetical protein [Azospirillum rugosum]
MELIGSSVYLLCFAASVVCMVLLVRSYARTRSRLLLWSAICFVCLAANNLLLFVDMLILPQIDLRPLRHLTALGGIGALLYGFVWDAE